MRITVNSEFKTILVGGGRIDHAQVGANNYFRSKTR